MKPTWERGMDDETLCDLLMLVGYDLPLAKVAGWTREQKAEAEKWAAKTHLKASDNNVRVPPKPQFVIAEGL